MSDHFFSRWSRRKQDAAKGLALDEPAPKSHPADVQPLSVTDDASPHTPSPDRPVAGASATAEASPSQPLPTLDDVQALTPESDFQAFMQQGVPAQVRNAAVKKLFADPHFNVMDGLDIYIGDYNIPDPLPAGMLQQMASAQFMQWVPPETPQSSGALTEENPHSSDAGSETSAVVAQSPHPHPHPHPQAAPAVHGMTPSEHDDPDLQLQPNHAPASPDPGPGAG
jgi:Protein of unknown function (DUF3306)